ncbi:protein-tyrosine phosphatase [Sporosarcina luteola]|nr:protein-tyrosine phosphatase [Sporosarcina luteola]
MNQFEKLANFRDIGGYQTTDGSRMKTGHLYRSGALSKLTESDIKKFEQLNIKLICDLRTPEEFQAKPSKIQTNDILNIVNVPLQQYETQDGNRRKLLGFLFGKQGEEQFDQFIRDYYRRMTFERTSHVNEVLSLIASEKNLPAVIHCTAGKDRTGIMAAIIQLLVGVPYEKVEENYLLTNQFYAQRLEKMSRLMRWLSLFRVTPERVKYIMEAKPEYLHEIYTEIMTEYGSIGEYVSGACQIDKHVVERLKEQLLE